MVKRLIFSSLLPPAYVVRREVMFSQVSVLLTRGDTPREVPPPPKVDTPQPWQDRERVTQGRYPPAEVGTPGQGRYPPPPPSTCYMAGGMPLTFTQEDFLVNHIIVFLAKPLLDSLCVMWIDLNVMRHACDSDIVMFLEDPFTPSVSGVNAASTLWWRLRHSCHWNEWSCSKMSYNPILKRPHL